MKNPTTHCAGALLTLTLSATNLSQALANSPPREPSPATPPKPHAMPHANSQPPQLPPEAARYLQGPPPESRQFDFLIGDWDVAATRYRADGTVLLQYRASWHANYLNEGRMVIDDFKALAPNGEALSSFVTLRSYCEATQRWELSGLAAHQRAAPAQWHGLWQDGEMHLDAIGQNPEGQAIRTKVRFFNIEAMRFSWESQTSNDGGQTWYLSAALTSTRR